MRLFNALIFDETLEGAGDTYCSFAWSLLLARAEAMRFTAIADTVSGTATLTTILLAGVGDMSAFDELEFARPWDSAPLSSGTVLSGSFSPADLGYPPSRYVMVLMRLAGTTPKAHVRLWVCGRGPQLLEQMPASAVTFAAQYQAARALDDENKPLPKKRLVKAGTSTFYPPELFLPSARWDR
jgi:hypothetical protein